MEATHNSPAYQFGAGITSNILKAYTMIDDNGALSYDETKILIDNLQFHLEKYTDYLVREKLNQCDRCDKPATLITSMTKACSTEHAPAWVAKARA